VTRDPNAWTAADYPRREGYERALTPAMLRELDAAAARLKGREFWTLTPDETHLPECAPLLYGVFHDLEYGPGFSLVSGLPHGSEDRDGKALLLAAFCRRLGRVVDQNVAKKKIEDITDRGLPMTREVRGYMGTHALAFHTDGADFTSLYCLGKAAEGGESVIIAVTAVHDAIARERPDILRILERGFHHHRRGEQPPGEPVMTERLPVFWRYRGLMHCLYNRNPPAWLEGTGISYTAAETEALDYLDAVLARPEMQLRMMLEPGDVQFINNYNILHGRTAYRDGPGMKRHLLRLWMSNPACRRAGPNIIDLYAPWDGRKLPAA
jgi:hypothetical protein